MNLMFKNIISNNIETLEIIKIITISNRLNQEKINFREDLAILLNEHTQIENRDFMIEKIVDFSNNQLIKQKGTKKLLKDFCSATFDSFFNYSIPVFLWAIPNGIEYAIATSIIASLSGTIPNLRKQWKPSSNNYYLEISKQCNQNNKYPYSQNFEGLFYEYISHSAPWFIFFFKY